MVATKTHRNAVYLHKYVRDVLETVCNERIILQFLVSLDVCFQGVLNCLPLKFAVCSVGCILKLLRSNKISGKHYLDLSPFSACFIYIYTTCAHCKTKAKRQTTTRSVIEIEFLLFIQLATSFNIGTLTIPMKWYKFNVCLCLPAEFSEKNCFTSKTTNKSSSHTHAHPSLTMRKYR